MGCGAAAACAFRLGFRLAVGGRLEWTTGVGVRRGDGRVGGMAQRFVPTPPNLDSALTVPRSSARTVSGGVRASEPFSALQTLHHLEWAWVAWVSKGVIWDLTMVTRGLKGSEVV